jgi:Ca2+-binding EF-hand superfamily protein
MSNFLKKYRDDNTKKLKNFTASQFAEVWTHYDSDGNGYIEGKELDKFLREFITSVLKGDEAESITEEDLKEMEKEFMATFDENADNKIEIRELARILPTEESFLLLFRRENPLESSADFMQIWKRFDKDRSGFIETNELEDFLRHMLQDAKVDVSPEKLSEYTASALKLFDQNGDGKLQLSEMARLLPVKDNFLAKPIFKGADLITSDQVDEVFRHYDRDGNGTIESDELSGFLKDLLASTHESYTESDLDYYKQIILQQWDVDHDGKINKDELKMLLSQQSRLAELEKN